MKKLLLVAVLGIAPLLLSGCGYQNSYLAAKRERAELETAIGAPVSLHVAMWSNRTNELGLQLVFFNALSTWFQGSDLIVQAKKSEQADYALDGEVVAINEGLTRGTVLLTVGYGLRDLRSGETVWRVPAQTFSESFFIADNAARTQDNKRQALAKIADDLAESIYMRTLSALRDRRTSDKSQGTREERP
jgi:hypothetical protein